MDSEDLELEMASFINQLADKLLEPIAAEHERNHTYPEGLFAQLGEVVVRGSG